MSKLKTAAEKHLADIVIRFVMDGGDPAKLLRHSVRPEEYELLRQALEACGWPEAGGKVQAWLDKKGSIFEKAGFGR